MSGRNVKPYHFIGFKQNEVHNNRFIQERLKPNRKSANVKFLSCCHLSRVNINYVEFIFSSYHGHDIYDQKELIKIINKYPTQK